MGHNQVSWVREPSEGEDQGQGAELGYFPCWLEAEERLFVMALDLQVGSGLGCCDGVVGALLEEEGLVGEGDCLHWELAGVFQHQGELFHQDYDDFGSLHDLLD